ncbi:MAG: hypothetical protein AB7G35_23615 [Hyphomicrobiaceae bacterium]
MAITLSLPSFAATSTDSDSIVIQADGIGGSVAAGDVAVLFDCAVGGSGNVTPDGWITVKSQSDGATGVAYDVSWKILEAGDIGATVVGQSPGAAGAKMMMFLRPSGGSIASVAASTWDGEVTSGNPASQSVLASGVAVPVVVFGMAFEPGTVNPAFSTASPAFDLTQGSATHMRVGVKIYNSSPANHTIDMGDLGGPNVLCSGYLRFAAGLTIAGVDGAYALTGEVVVLRQAREVGAAIGAYGLTGSNVALTKSGIHLLVAGAGAYGLTGAAVSPLRSRLAVAAAGAYSLTGVSASVLWGRSVQAASGFYALTGADVGLEYSVGPDDFGQGGAWIGDGRAPYVGAAGDPRRETVRGAAGGQTVAGNGRAVVATGGGLKYRVNLDR